MKERRSTAIKGDAKGTKDEEINKANVKTEEGKQQGCLSVSQWQKEQDDSAPAP